VNGLPWEERIDAPDLAWARIGVGVAALAAGVHATLLFDRATRPGVLRIPVVDWLPAPSVILVLLLGGVWLVAAGSFAVGSRTRLSGPVLAVTMAFTMMLDLQFYSNHLYLLALLLVLLTAANAGGYRSLDVGAGRAPAGSPVWGVFLLRAQVSIVYLFGALSTVKLAYASEAVLTQNLRRSGPLALPEAWRTPDLVAALAVSSIFLQFWLAAALWSPRRRRSATVVGIAYHVALLALVADAWALGIFGLAMVSAYAAFYVPLPGAAPALELEIDGV
jgi:hypothetical protein